MNTLFFGKQIIHLSEIDSTNNYTIQLIRQSVMSEGGVVITDNQYQGRGQRGNLWLTEEKQNLTFSLYLKPKFLPLSQQFLLSKCICLGLVDFLTELGIENCMVKWPNDIYVGNKKIGGILIENLVQSNFYHSIVGIGLNVNQTKFEGLESVTSILSETGKIHDLRILLEQMCNNLERRYLKFTQNIHSVNEEYLKYLYQKDVVAKYSDEKGVFSGKIIGVDPIGQLIVKKQNQEKESTYSMKEITFLT